jgi:F-type H+-transporting ATPase subunit b
MPQLSLDFFVSQIFWLAVSFLTLYLLLRIFVFPKMSLIFNERRSKIDGTIASTKQAKALAIDIESEYKSKLSHAKKKSALSIAQTIAELEQSFKKKMINSENDFKKMVDDSNKKIKSFQSDTSVELTSLVVNSSKIVLDKLGFTYKDKEIESILEERVRNGF